MLDPKTGACEHCRGRVTNATGNNLDITALIDIHRPTCPGLNRRTTTK